jgi:hypothetical protein
MTLQPQISSDIKIVNFKSVSALLSNTVFLKVLVSIVCLE